MAETEQKAYGGRWRVVGNLGRGGQGEVFLVEDMAGRSSRELTIKALAASLRQLVGAGTEELYREHGAKVIDLIEEISARHSLPKGALKKLLPFEEAVNAETALARMKEELEALKAVNHPSLIKVLDEQIGDRWFVTEYFRNGTLAAALGSYIGSVQSALRAFRPICEAVAELHKAGVVHRDIKPDNVFIADDRHLVLGDCGLAFRQDKSDRLTLSFENVGSRDWMPGWAISVRLADVKPTFDVFSLGKLLWSMISGLPRLQLWYFDEEPNDLRRLIPDTSGAHLVHRILAKCIVQREAQCKLANGAEMLEEIDVAIQALQTGGQVPTTKKPMRCRFCGVGDYQSMGLFGNQSFADPQDKRYTYLCDNCGHMESFYFRKNNTPPGWFM